MRCPSLEELPSPPDDKTGWPWTGESIVLPGKRSTGQSWPRLSIVTPSFNQADFLEATIRSVLLQGYPNLEYVVIDGGSNDGSQRIIQKYERWLTYWVSETDNGQYDAINKGFQRTSGEIMAWLNSDDMYFSNAFKNVGEIFLDLKPKVRWITGVPTLWDSFGFTFSVMKFPRYKREHIRLGLHDDRGLPFIQQESTFWTRDLWRLVGGNLNADLQFAADYDLWCKFAAFDELYFVDVPFSGFRLHGRQKTALSRDKYFKEVDEILSEKREIYWLNKFLKSSQGKRVLIFYNKIRRSKNNISYHPIKKVWEIVTWAMSQ